VSLLFAALAILGALGFEVGLGRFAPGASRYVDALMLPVVWYALARSQRSAMLAGCALGLLEDVWLRGGTLGVAGLAKTVVGWALGGLGARFDLNNPWGRLASGGLATTADALLQMALFRFLDLATGPFDPLEMGLRALTGGLLTFLVFAILRRGSRRKPGAKPVLARS
jgi:rod shape-determining protein MreD